MSDVLGLPSVSCRTRERRNRVWLPVARACRKAGSLSFQALGNGAKVRAYRNRKRAAGYRPVQYWVPDTRSPEYRARLHRQIEALKNDPAEDDAIAWAEAAASDIEGWEWGAVILQPPCCQAPTASLVLVIQSDDLAGLNSIVVCSITSHVRDFEVRIILKLDLSNGLEKPSQVMCDKISILPATKICDRIGSLDATTLQEIDQQLMVVIGLA